MLRQRLVMHFAACKDFGQHVTHLLADAQRADRLGLGGVAMSRHGHASGRISSRETFNVFARERHTLMLPARVPFSIPETVIFEISILDASSAWVRPRYRLHPLRGQSGRASCRERECQYV